MEQRNLTTTVDPGTQPNGQAAIVATTEQRAREMAARYRCEFLDLRDYHLDAELF
jgi:hypothetical protein